MKYKKLFYLCTACVLIIGVYLVGSSSYSIQSDTTKVSTGEKKTPPSPDLSPGKESDVSLELQKIPIIEQPIPGTPVVTNEKQAEIIITGQKIKLGLGEQDELTVKGDTKDNHGNAYYQIQQKFKGIPIYGARSILEIEQGKAVVLSGKIVTEINVNTLPTHPPKEALLLALKKLGMPDDLQLKLTGDKELIVFVSTQNKHLAWHLTVNFEKPAIPSEIMFVDAHDPKILARMPLEVH